MRVADFFCGAGGFSEGFRQAGFEIVFAVDKWAPAVNTHHANHPSAQTYIGDVEEIAYLPEDEFEKLVPDTEIIIGSPPCVAFSNSNKSGKGDKSLGIRLLKAYLRIIARKKFKKNSILKYWVLENVPNIQKYVKPIYTAADLNFEDEFELKTIYDSSGTYNAQYFGVASKRTRFLCGEFPLLQQTINNDKESIPLKHILKGLGSPCENVNTLIKDPNYNFEMISNNITDHHYISELAEFEWKKAKRLKEDKGYMGKMAFPENEDKPARTIMATMSCSSRESMILNYKNSGYRLPTVREVASIMSFPIDYRFYGTSKSIKYKLVGNAVPPKLSYAIAKAIAVNEGIEYGNGYNPITHDNLLPFVNLNYQIFPLNMEKTKRNVAKFKNHIPYMILQAYRVELTNYGSDFDKLNFKWDAEIHKSQGKSAKVFTPSIDINILSEDLKSSVLEFIGTIRPKLKSHNEFQNIYCLTSKDRKQMIGPDELLEEIKSFIENKLDNNLIKNIVKLEEMPYELPLAIVIGYIILKIIIEFMGDKQYE